MSTAFARLRRGFFASDAPSLAAALIGCHLVRRLDDGAVLAGRIVETEAYVGVEDRASHAFGGRRTARNEAMYGRPGTAYVYFTYGMHHCFNIVCGREGEPAAVLVRALSPVVGADRMRVLRAAASRARDTRFAEERLCAGPARLCQALAIGREMDGLDLCTDPGLFVARRERNWPRGAPGADNRVVRAARVGVAYAGAWSARPLRWLVSGDPSVSVGAGSAGRGAKGR